MTARGLVKFKGLYRHPEDVEAQVQKQRDAEAEKSWYPKIKQWSAFVWTGDAGRQQQAMTNLQAIRDPNAVPALQRILGTDNREDARLLYVMLLSNIDDERSRVALVIQSLQDDSVEVRQAAVAAISLNDHERVLAIYIQALRHESNTIVNRAAYALGEVTQKEDWPKVMPLLIEALVTVHYHKAIVPNLTNSYPFTRSGSPAITGYDVLQMMLLGEPPILSRKGPPPPGFPGPLKVANVSQERLNLSVQGALQKLSGKKYRPSIPVWRSWWTTEGMLETIPLSRPLEK